MEEMRESAKDLYQTIDMYEKCVKDGQTELMAHAPKYVIASKLDIMTQNYSFDATLCFSYSRYETACWRSLCSYESPKGELGFYINSQGGPYPYRLKTPSAHHFGIQGF